MMDGVFHLGGGVGGQLMMTFKLVALKPQR